MQPIGGSGEQPKTFTFDNVFDWNSSQTAVYTETAKPIVDSVLEGYNGTVFAYGQTGTGKTHTMDGGAGDAERGIIPKTFDQIFEAIQARLASSCMHLSLKHALLLFLLFLLPVLRLYHMSYELEMTTTSKHFCVHSHAAAPACKLPTMNKNHAKGTCKDTHEWCMPHKIGDLRCVKAAAELQCSQQRPHLTFIKTESQIA